MLSRRRTRLTDALLEWEASATKANAIANSIESIFTDSGTVEDPGEGDFTPCG